jgi:tetratricopeptide (TPR) repeat protein
MALSKKKTRNLLPRGILDKEWAGKETPVQLIAVFALFLILFLFINFLTGFFSFIVPSALIMSFVLYLAFKIRKSGRPDIELAEFEEYQEKEARKIIINKLGILVFMYLNPTAKAMNVYQTDICKKLLNRGELKRNKELKFHIYLKLYRFYFIDEDYPKAIDALNSALNIKQNDLITNIRLAETYELLGNGDKAINTYKAIKTFNDISENSKIYFDNQIKRVIREGPKKATPMTGFRYFTH